MTKLETIFLIINHDNFDRVSDIFKFPEKKSLQLRFDRLVCVCKNLKVKVIKFSKELIRNVDLILLLNVSLKIYLLKCRVNKFTKTLRKQQLDKSYWGTGGLLGGVADISV